jgi:hypothetical protein
MTRQLKAAELIVNLLDTKFNVWGFRFGLDPIIGLIPGLGDFLSFLISLYVIWLGVKMKLPPRVILGMVINVFLDFLIGTVPIVGNIFDFVFKANVRNLETLKKYS